MKSRSICRFAYFLLAISLIFVSFANSADLQISVVDENGAELSGATITLRPIGSGTTYNLKTNSDGTLQFDQITDGSYGLTVSRDGYTTKNVGEIELSSDLSTQIEVKLSKSTFKLDEVAVTASRKKEKVLSAPASISTLYSKEIQNKVAATATDHIKSLPAVDSVTSGLTQSNVVVRGFNNIFSGSLLSLVDNRIARVPSLRVNTYSMIPTSNLDIDRIEVVSGPGSALYGPNSSGGVLHILTKSPIGSEGTTVTVGGGERSVLTSSLRHAMSFNDQIGFKISGQYYRGHDWEYEDKEETAYLTSANKSRNFDLDKLSGEARVDLKLTDDLTAIFSAGFTQINQIELTGIGAGQGIDWIYSFAQGRLIYKDLFAQFFINQSDAGDTFLLRTGNPIIDKSKLMVGQIQHGLSIGDRQRFTYGLDLLLTRPNTEGTINGKNEDNDSINEIGAYLQSETHLPSNLKFIAAARIDKHNFLEDPVFSPRAALVFSPIETQNFRLTFNRAFSTPSSNTLFLDLVAAKDVFGLGKTFENPAFATNVRAQGVGKSGFHFKRSDDGQPMFRMPFATDQTKFFPLNDPIATKKMWDVSRDAVMSALLPNLQGLVKAQLAQLGLPPGMIDLQVGLLPAAFDLAIPKQISSVKNNTMTLNIETSSFDLPREIIDVDPIRPTVNQTIEAGYKGILANRLAISVDVYQSSYKDFVGPLLVETPTVFLDGESLAASISKQLAQTLADPKFAMLNGMLIALDDPEIGFGGNENGTPIDELTRLFVEGTDKNGAAYIPFGTISPEEATDPTAIVLTYRNYGDISLYGADLRIDFYLNDSLSLSGNYSYVSNDYFEKEQLALNAPKNKFGASIRYANADLGFGTQLQYRYVAGFPVNSGVYFGEIEPYGLIDLNATYAIPIEILGNSPQISLTVQNLLDTMHQEFIGVPEIGRLSLIQISQSF